MKADEVLRRYAAGERDFRRTNLRGQSFKGKNLSGANFSEADIRGANFTNAKLSGASFSSAKAGLQRRWVFFWVIVALVLLGLSGLASLISGNYVTSLLIIASKQITIVPGLVVSIIYLIFLISAICQEFELAVRLTIIAVGIVFTVSMAINVLSFGSINSFDNVVRSSVYSIKVDSNRPLTNPIAITAAGAAASSFAAAIANTTIVTSVVTASFSSALLEVIANLGFLAPALTVFFPYFLFSKFFLLVQATAQQAAFATTVFGFNVAASIVSRDGSSGVTMMTSASDNNIFSAIGSVIAATIILLSTYISQQILGNKKKYNLVYKIIIALAAAGGTSFRHADLTDANFASATLKSTDFRNATLIRTCWHHAKKLDRVRPGTTYLQFPQVLKLLITGQGQAQNFDHQPLRGVNLQGANLADASFIGTDLSSANLQDADLSRVKLVQTQLDETDLTGATLTGATIEDWGITSHTKLDGVRCEYVFMRLPTKEDPNPRRKPDNWNETFCDGDFADFIKPIVDTLDLYHNQDVDPRAIAISFNQLAENHPDAELRIVGMEVKGEDKFLLRAKTAKDVNYSELNTEYFTIYNRLKVLAEQDLQALIAEKDRRIFSLETMVATALERPSFYTQTYQNYGDTMSERKISIDQSSASIGVGYSENVNTEQVGGTIHNYAPEQKQTLAEAAAEIQKLLKQLEETYPTATEEEKETVLAIKVQQEIKRNPTFKARLRNALKEGGIEALKVLFAPVGIPIEMVRGWIEAEAE